MNYSKVDFVKILEYFNVKNAKPYGKEIQFSCPFPEHFRGDKNPSAGINTETGKWHCFSCGRKGSLVSFVAELEGVDQAVASRWIRTGFDAAFGEPSAKAILKKALEPTPKKQYNNPIPKSALELFYVNWSKAYEAYTNESLPKKLSYIYDRGFSASTLQEYSIGYDEKSKRITIPLYNSRGDLLGFKGRTTSIYESSKYLGVGDREHSYYGFPTCKTHELVFGIQTLNLSDEYAILVEGEFDALMLRQNGFETAIALGGSSPSKEQIDQIKSSCNKAILFFDDDKAGKIAESNLTQALIPFMPLRIAKVVENKDPAEMNKEEVTKAIQNAINPLKHIRTGSD